MKFIFYLLRIKQSSGSCWLLNRQFFNRFRKLDPHELQILSYNFNIYLSEDLINISFT